MARAGRAPARTAPVAGRGRLRAEADEVMAEGVASRPAPDRAPGPAVMADLLAASVTAPLLFRADAASPFGAVQPTILKRLAKEDGEAGSVASRAPAQQSRALGRGARDRRTA